MRKLFFIIPIVGVAVWILWPYFALYELFNGLEEGNPVVLERRVEWESVRRGLRDDANAMFLAMNASDHPANGRNDFAKGLSVIFGPALINQIIDAYVTPQTISNLIRLGSYDKDENQIASKKNDQTQIWKKIQYAFFSGGPFTFIVEMGTDSKVSRHPVTLLLTWGGDWKLVRVFLPADATIRLAFDRAKVANTIEAWDAFLNYFGKDPLAKEARNERQKLVDKEREHQKKLFASNTIDWSDHPQKAILFEEDPKNPQGERSVGRAVWHTEMKTLPPSTVPDMRARADILIPTRGLQIRWTLVRNTDANLPASHTIEIMFIPTIQFGGGIANVPGILMKDAELGRGIPLAGLAVKVSDSYFLEGLSAVKADLGKNIRLLKTQSWVDIPLVYTNGRRAILALQIGDAGRETLRKAFSYWEGNPTPLKH